MPKACDAPSGALNTTQAKRSVVKVQAATQCGETSAGGKRHLEEMRPTQ